MFSIGMDIASDGFQNDTVARTPQHRQSSRNKALLVARHLDGILLVMWKGRCSRKESGSFS